MEISRFDDAAAFLRHAGRLLRTNAIDNNVMLGIAGRLADAPQAGAPDDGAVMVTVDGGGAPRLAGLMTPPWRLIVSTGDAGAIPALVDALLEIGPRPPGVVGLAAMAEGFAAAWAAATGDRTGPAVAMNLYVSHKAVVPAAASGALRSAKTAESEWVAECFVEFAIAIDPGESERGESRTSAAAYLARDEVWVWDVDGAPVAMVCCTHMAPEGARVPPVYTPPALRAAGATPRRRWRP
jgi:hypothetical protein